MRDRNKYITVGVLTCINLLNYMDRFTIAGRLRSHDKAEQSNYYCLGCACMSYQDGACDWSTYEI